METKSTKDFNYSYKKPGNYHLTKSDKIRQLFLYPAIFLVVSLSVVIPFLNTGKMLTVIIYSSIVYTVIFWVQENYKSVKTHDYVSNKVDKLAVYDAMLSLEKLKPVTEWLIAEDVYSVEEYDSYTDSLNKIGSKIFYSLQNAINESQLGDKTVSWAVNNKTVTVGRSNNATIQLVVHTNEEA